MRATSETHAQLIVRFFEEIERIVFPKKAEVKKKKKIEVGNNN